MGNSKSKKMQKEPDKLFEREKWKEIKREEKKKKLLNSSNKRSGMLMQALSANMPPPSSPPTTPPGPGPSPAPAHSRSYDDEALERMRYQLQSDSDAFLLNNILLSVQFFENYEREAQHVKSNPINEHEHAIDEAMVRHHKHVYFADRMQECVYEHVGYQRGRGHHVEPILSPRLFVIYDNVEASEPGDMSDYSAVLDAPFYKLRIESCKEQGYVKLKKVEVLNSAHSKDKEITNSEENIPSDDSVYADSEKESNDSDDSHYYVTKGETVLNQIQSKLNEVQSYESNLKSKNITIHPNINEPSLRRYSGPTKRFNSQVTRSNIKNLNNMNNNNIGLPEEVEFKNSERDSMENDTLEDYNNISKPRKSILKTSRRPSGPTKKDVKIYMEDVRKASAENLIAEDTETSGYRSNSSSRQNESSETESDYGYSTITESTTPKKIELRVPTNFPLSSGVLPEDCWSTVQVKAVDSWSDDEDDEDDSNNRNLYETYYYLNSSTFMSNFADNFMIKLGSALGLAQDEISNALTQGASIYCDSLKKEGKISYEVFPALIASWPSVADQWIIRERKVIKNPRTNFTYQWPTRNMVRKTREFGCLLIPLGFRPKRGLNPEQKLQWRIVFPAAERYLESCLAHSHMRCYMFAITLYKSFLENEASKIGIDSSHIKNHLFWQCEDNYAKWPEDRLGETLRVFLRSFYVHFGKAKYPNYFIETCNDFKTIPHPLLLKIQRRLADILEAPVMHLLYALEKLKYIKKDFYPTFNCKRLYQILTCKNPLRILNPNIPINITSKIDNSDSEDEHDTQYSFWDRAKAQDKHYLWTKRKHDLMEEKRKANINRKQKTDRLEIEINKNIILPAKMEVVRRRLVLEFFIPHFIAMARSSEKFEAIRQAVIYLEHAQRLCTLLLDEPSGETTAKEYLDVIRDKLTDCHSKLVNLEGYKLPSRRESALDRTTNFYNATNSKYRPIRYEPMTSQDSPTPTDTSGIPAFTFVDVHVDMSRTQDTLKLNDGTSNEEESKL